MQVAAGRNHEIRRLTIHRDKLIDRFVRVFVYRDSTNKLKLTSRTQE